MKSLFSYFKRKKVFAVPLETAIKLSPAECSGIPLPVYRAVAYIEKNIDHLEGVYRVGGSLKSVKELQLKYDSGNDPNLDEIEDGFVIASLLKKFFSQLPEPVMTYQLYDSFLEAHAKYKDETERAQYIKQLVNRLPSNNYKVVRFIIQHLRNISYKSDFTKMSVDNLAIVFGPTLFRSLDESPVTILRDTPAICSCVKILVNHFEFIFENEKTSQNVTENNPKQTLETRDVYIDTRTRQSIAAISSTNSPWINRYEKMMAMRRGRSLRPRDDPQSFTEEELKQVLKSVREEEQKRTLETVSIDINEHLSKRKSIETKEDLSNEEKKEENKDAQVEDEEKFFERLKNEFPIDIKNPLEAVKQRITLRREREGRTSDLHKMDLNELIAERKLLKRELKLFDIVFKQETGEEPTTEDKVPLKEIYMRYRMTKELIENLSLKKTKDAENEKQIPSSLLENPEFIELRKKKRELQTKLIKFQNEFYKQHGRKVTKKSDRKGMENEYEEYYKLKQTLNDMIQEAQLKDTHENSL